MKAGNSSPIILPDWQVPSHVKAFSTTRSGGVSRGAFGSNNLASHVNDDKADVLKNRALLREKYELPSEPFWLNQTHSIRIVEAGIGGAGDLVDADASFSHKAGEVCAVMTADCLPILLCDREGRQVAAIHAGWRGLLNGIIEETVQQFTLNGGDIVAWLGPAIGPKAFEVGPEVRDLFIDFDLDALQSFRQCTENKWLANIYELAKLRLKSCGVASIYGGDYCTFSDESTFYSYRRDNVCGRMATLIWLDK
ncbi:MAG: peptidoglycan editing factor PgeF [Gammaproteobacteria bacterium]|nr:peptidoglycan editing factor PgeF [Gammaproteobacteria bacterium]